MDDWVGRAWEEDDARLEEDVELCEGEGKEALP